MATSVWKGHLTFGLVSVPIKLVRAARAEKISFRQLHKATGRRVQHKLVVEAPLSEHDQVSDEPDDHSAELASHGREIEPPKATPITEADRSAPLKVGVGPEALAPREVRRDELIKGFEYEKDRYAVLTSEELKALQQKTSHTMEILEFVKLTDVDPIYFETSYYAIPEAAGERSYALLFESLRQSNLVGVAQMAMHNREHFVIVRAGRKGIILHTMFYENEIRRLDEYRTESGSVNQKELDLALMLVRALEARFEPEKYRDSYRQKLEELISLKLNGNEVVQAGNHNKAAPVIDILEALKKSLEKAAARKPPTVDEAGSAVRKRRSTRKEG